jgi:cell fate regulator YaaT (PSP1 superfamily)
MTQDNPGMNPEEKQLNNYKIQFRKKDQIFFAVSRIPNLKADEIVMVQTDHNLEPARIVGLGPFAEIPMSAEKTKECFTVQRRGTRDEGVKYDRLVEQEFEAFNFCLTQIKQLDLAMKLIRVERFFNGSKIIFYFTAESRVDFRQLVKNLVQEFRTRIEMRQIGVRHESKMIGGIGCCGRELCCSSYIDMFAPVSIKMAKEQDLPLNPSKISGICNRLLCCLTYEYDTYRNTKKNMPKPGKSLFIDKKQYTVAHCNVLEQSVTIYDQDHPEKQRVLTKEEWEAAQKLMARPKKSGPSRKPPAGKKEKSPKKGRGGRRRKK